MNCASESCGGPLTLVEAESGLVWGGVCRRCGKHNEKCQVCGKFFLQMWRHLKLIGLWAGNGPEPEERIAKRERAQTCYEGNQAWRTARALKGRIAP